MDTPNTTTSPPITSIVNNNSYSNLLESTNDVNLNNLIQLFGNDLGDKSNKEDSQNSLLLTNATQIVVSFVFLNKQASLFNLLIQMLTTNTFSATSLATSSQLPFQHSPTPIPPKSLPNESNTNTTTTTGTNEKSSQMFNILHEAINAVSQQFQKNFYCFLLEKLDTSQQQTPQTIANHEALIAGCLSFINHMMSCAPTFFDCERYRQLLSAQGVNDIIKGYIKSVHPDIRSELLNFQKHKTISIRSAKQTPNTQESRENVLSSFLSRLLKMSFPTQELSQLTDQEKLKRLGFESTDPYDELLSTGILGLRNLIYFAARYSRIYSEILEAQSSPQNTTKYSFIRVGMNLTNLLYEIYIEDENIYEIIFDQDDWFEELFCISFELFDEVWEREGKTEEDFVHVLVKTRTILSRLKWTNPESISSFQTTLGNVLDEMWTKIENIREEKEMSARVGGLSDSIIGLPHLPPGSSPTNGNMNSPTYRFQKFFGERFKSHRKSTEFSVHMDDSASVNSEKSSASNSSLSVGGSNENLVHKSPSQHRVHTKSLSFKKLFNDLKEITIEKKKDQDEGSSSNMVQINGNSSETGSSPKLSSSQQIEISDTQSQHSNAGDDQSNLDKLGSMAKKFIKNVKNKATGTSTRNLHQSTSNYDISSSSGNESPITLSSSTPINSDSPNLSSSTSNLPLNESSPGIGGSIKSSGSYIYKSVRKAMANIEKKSKTITRKVKRKKAKKPSNPNSISNNSNNSSLNNSNNPISIYANGDHEFQPSLDLDFDRNSDDSSYEYTEEEIEVEIDDSMSVGSSTYENGKITKSKSVDILSNQLSISKLNLEQPSSVPMTSSTSQDLLHPPPISISSRTESEQSLTDAASLNSAIKQKQLEQSEKSENSRTNLSAISKPIHQLTPNGSSGENSPRSNNASPRGSPKVSRAHTLDLKKPVLSRAPIPASFIPGTSNTTTTPTIMSKSPSIKHLVNFFEVKSSTSTVSSNSAIPILKKEKSFKSDVDSTINEELEQNKN